MTAIFLRCGAPSSPLPLLSGIGPALHLRYVGVLSRLSVGLVRGVRDVRRRTTH